MSGPPRDSCRNNRGRLDRRNDQRRRYRVHGLLRGDRRRYLRDRGVGDAGLATGLHGLANLVVLAHQLTRDRLFAHVEQKCRLLSAFAGLIGPCRAGAEAEPRKCQATRGTDGTGVAAQNVRRNHFRGVPHGVATTVVRIQVGRGIRRSTRTAAGAATGAAAAGGAAAAAGLTNVYVCRCFRDQRRIG